MVKMMKRNKILLDLNIILDVFLKREPFFQDSYKVFDLCYSQKIHGIIAAHSLSTLLVCTTKTSFGRRMPKNHFISFEFL